MAEMIAFYIHGLGRPDLKRSIRTVLDWNQKRGVDFRVARFDWRQPVTFPQLLEQVTQQVVEVMDSLVGETPLLLQGTSAGGSLAFNIAHQLNDPRVRAVSHSGRLAAGNYGQRDFRNLKKAAHLNTEKASRSFYDSVVHFENIVAPSLTKEQKERMLITKPWADEVVPVNTMVVDGIRTVTVPMVGHGAGIGVGMLRLPSLI